MGLTWIMGFVADYFNSNVLWYIFVALNAFQVTIQFAFYFSECLPLVTNTSTLKNHT
jgi:hypothetical protein